jgi:prepilin-type processing-associated H-X9-DG protein
MYVDDNENNFPYRRLGPFWCTFLYPYFQNPKILVCAAEPPNPLSFGKLGSSPTLYPKDAYDRSYIINGWNDFVEVNFPAEVAKYKAGKSEVTLSDAYIKEPSETIVFGEKENDSPHFYMDFEANDDILQLDQSRHSSPGSKTKTGGSNYLMADGSARFIKYSRSLVPINLWAVTDIWRTNNLPWMP